MTRASPTVVEKRLGYIAIRVNDQERDIIRRAARQAHIEVSSWLRSIAVQRAEELLDPKRRAG